MSTQPIHRETIGKTRDGRPVLAYTLENETGLRATFLNFGGILVELEVPDRVGMSEDITLGLDAVEDYLEHNTPYFGALVGRFANRIARGTFTLDGREVTLPLNEEAAHLHGGPAGFSRQLFESEVSEGPDGQSLVFRYTSPDGEMGYPGCLKLAVEISLTAANGLRYAYSATTDAPTILNLTAHPYFNLTSQDAGSIRQHLVQIEAAAYLPIDPETRTPTGLVQRVADSPFDLRNLTSLDHRLESPHPQMELAGGYDHCFVLDPDRDLERPVATVIDESTGRRMEVLTSEPGIQFYTANSLDGTLAGKNGTFYPRHAGLCLETQHFPDSPNNEAFPSTRLDPGQTFTSFTEYRFSTT